MAYVVSLFILLASISVKAEYRAFLLKITKADSQDQRLVKSNLDPRQYQTYYHLPPNHTVEYIETWMCKGRTGDFKEVCLSPKEEAARAAEVAPN